MSVRSPHLILTTLHRLPATAVTPFFLSLKRINFSGSVVVFASGISKESVLQLQRWGANVESFRFSGKHVVNRLARLWPIWRLVFASLAPEIAKRQLAHLVFHLFYRRHLLYLEFLRRPGVSYERILTTDCRDVFFQTDPFDWRQTEGLHVFLEEESLRIKENAHHVRWIRSQFGEKVLQSLGNDTVSCAGTVFGDRTGMDSYLSHMVQLAMKARSLREADGDQGLHNFLVRGAGLPKMTIHRNREGPVMTLGMMKMGDLRFSHDGWVTNETKKVVPVLHQYDRISALGKILLGHLSLD